MRVRLFDEMDVIDLDEPWVPRMYCPECRRKTAYRYDAFDLPMCVEHQEQEESHA